jgi:hypothetical protein
MTSQLIQRISLDGGKEFEAALSAIGVAGKDAFDKLKSAMASAASTTGPLASSIQSAGARIKELSNLGGNLHGSLNNLGSSIQTVATRFGLMQAAVVGASLGFERLIKSSARAVSDMDTAAKEAGMTIEQYQVLKKMFEQSGVEEEAITGIMRHVAQWMDEAANGTHSATNALTKYKIEAKDASGNLRSTFDVIVDLAKAMQTAASTPVSSLALGLRQVQTDASALSTIAAQAGIKVVTLGDGAGAASLRTRELSEAAASFGRQGAAFAAAIDKVTGSRERFDKVLEAGGGLSTQDAEAARKMDIAFRELDRTFSNLRGKVALIFGAPAVEIIEALTQELRGSRNAILAWAKDSAQAVKEFTMEFMELLRTGSSAVPGETFAKEVYTSFVALKGIAITVKDAVVAAFNAIVSAIRPVSAAINQLFGTNLTPQAQAALLVLAAFSGVFSLIGASISGVIAVVSALWAAIQLFAGVTTLFANPWVLAIAAVVAALYELYQNWGAIKQGFLDGVTAITSFFRAKFEAVLTWLFEKLDRVMRLLGLASSADSSSSTADTSSAGGFASGGYVRGPGTSTSDSIRAWLSNGEFVVNAAAVRRVGVNVLHTINDLGKSSVGALHFATGGFVSPATTLASLAQPPATEPLRPFTLQIGSDLFPGLTAPEGVAQSLVKFATNKQARSMGSKPSWY